MAQGTTFSRRPSPIRRKVEATRSPPRLPSMLSPMAAAYACTRNDIPHGSRKTRQASREGLHYDNALHRQRLGGGDKSLARPDVVAAVADVDSNRVPPPVFGAVGRVSKVVLLRE